MLGVMLTMEERAMLETLAAENGLSMSAYLRLLIKQADRDRTIVQIPRKTKKRATEYAI
jgi:hypothetical protein